jgi:hypothetical protein
MASAADGISIVATLQQKLSLSAHQSTSSIVGKSRKVLLASSYVIMLCTSSLDWLLRSTDVLT